MIRYLSTTTTKSQGSKTAHHNGSWHPMAVCRWRQGNGTADFGAAGFGPKDRGARNTGPINLHGSSRQIALADCASGAANVGPIGAGVASFGAMAFSETAFAYQGGNLSAHRIDRPILGLLDQFILEQHLDRDGWRRSGRYSGMNGCSPVPRED
jgi:hypothetical protein